MKHVSKLLKSIAIDEIYFYLKALNANLFDIDAEIEEVLVFARHRLAIQTPSLTRQNALEKHITYLVKFF